MSSRVVTLVGPGGVGKTRVAVRGAEAERRSYRDGCWMVSLADIPAPELLATAVAGLPAYESDAEATCDCRRVLDGLALPFALP